jgi:transcriptional pleiotropic regulator of transition state genes
MINSGMTRHVDDLGRIVIPAELRRTMGLKDGHKIDISVEDERIILTPRQDACVFCGSKADLKEFRGRQVCASCVIEVSTGKSSEWDPFAQT